MIRIVAIIALFITSTLHPAFGYDTKPDPPEFVITVLHQTLEFYEKKGEVTARVTTELMAEPQVERQVTFERGVFIDNTSSLGRIRVAKEKKKAKKIRSFIEPIVTDYNSGGIFHSDLKLCYFTLSTNISEGSKYITYDKEYSDLKFLDPMYFNDSYPVEESYISIKIPAWMDVDAIEWNFDKEAVTKTEEKTDDGTTVTYKLSSIPARGLYNNEPRSSKTNAHLIPIVKSYKAGGKTVRGMKETADLYGWYAGLVEKMKDKPEVLRSTVDKLVGGKETDIEKIKAIYYWVQENIRYVAFEYGIMGFKPEECQDVYSNKYGDCKGMANLTKQMLTLAGYDARLTWVGTTDLPYNYDIPALIVDNHMICTVLIDGKRIYLDATEKYADFATYAPRIQGKQVMIEDGDSYIIDVVPTSDHTNNAEVANYDLTIENAELLIGSGAITFTGAKKSSIQYGLSTVTAKDQPKAIVSYITNGSKNVKVRFDEELELDAKERDLVVPFDVKIENNITNLGSEMYVNIELEQQLKTLTMPPERDVAFEFSSKYHIETTTTLSIPDGWKVTYLPETVDIDEGKYRFFLDYKVEGQKVVYKKVVSIKEELLELSEFKSWNKHIKSLRTNYEDQIVLAQ